MVTTAQQAVLNKIQPLTKLSPWFKACIYGEAGCGKTVLSSSIALLEEIKGVLLVEVEREGSLSLLNHPSIKDRVKVLQLAEVTEVEYLVDALREGAMPEIDVVIIDTSSELANRNLDEMVDTEIAKPNSNRSDPYDAQIKDYKRNTNAMRRLLVKLTDLPRHVIITAHEVVIESKDAKGNVLSTYIRPDFSPKYEKTVRALCSLVGYMYKDEKKEGDKMITTRYLRVSGTRRVYAKTRIGGLPLVIENPTMEFLLGKFRAMLNGSVSS